MSRTSPETATLKPCPFCGSAPIMDLHHENEDGTGIIEFVVVRCSSCRTSKERPSPSAAAQAWNRRDGVAQSSKDTMKVALESALEYVEADLRERFSVSGQNVRDEIRSALSVASPIREAGK